MSLFYLVGLQINIKLCDIKASLIVILYFRRSYLKPLVVKLCFARVELKWNE